MRMKCPHCEKEISGSPCPNCGEPIGFEEANYCMACGAPLKEDLERVPPREDTMDDDNGFDLDDRILCPDGTCTGIIVEGRCSECGRAVGDDGQFVEPKPNAVETKPSEDVAAEKTVG